MIQPYIVRSLSTRQIVLLTVMSALCVGIQLTPRPPNVEFTSLIIFLIGAVFGVSFGATLGILVMFINGFLSPWGFAGLLLPFQIGGMVIIGIVGGLYGRTMTNSRDARSYFEIAVLGAFLTLVYDVITNFGVAVSYMLIGTSAPLAFVNAIIFGAIFSVVHIVSNAAVFGMILVPLASTMERFLGGEKTWRRELLPT